MKKLHLLIVGVLLFSMTANANDNHLAQANNPLANMVQFNIQNYYMSDLTDTDEDANITYLRYALPTENMIWRATLPIPTVPTGKNSSKSGVGDFNIFGAYILSENGADTTIGVGPMLTAPTASNDDVGTGKWQAGAAAVIYNASNPVIQWGGLITAQTSFAGDDDRNDVSNVAIQPFYFFQLGKGTYLRGAPIMNFNTENGNYAIPVSLGIGKILKQKKTVYNFYIEPQFTVAHEGSFEPQTQVLMGLNIQFLTK